MKIRDKEWRKKELSLEEVIKKYPHLPESLIIKMDAKRRKLAYTQAALERLDPQIHQVQAGAGIGLGGISDKNTQIVPEGLTLPDGSFIVFASAIGDEFQRDPYLVDVVDDKIVITDQGKVLTEVEYWEKPDFYDKKTKDGRPMSNFVGARPQRLDIALSHYCHFWDTPGEGCKYCAVTPGFLKSKRTDMLNDIDAVAETVKEALKQKGRYSAIMVSGGSILSGEEPFDDEVNGYIEILQRIGENFKTKRFPSQLISTAFSEKQLERLYENTGIMTYTADLEVLSKERFEYVCPGKARHVGFDEWKRRLYAAVDIFGKGNVNTAFVVGTELAGKGGYTDLEEAHRYNYETAQELAEHGVGFAANIWFAAPGSIFGNQDTPSLDYYVRFFDELDQLRRKYDLGRYIDDYRRCGSHEGSDLNRI